MKPSARVTGIDLSQRMLSALTKKFTDKDITLILGSYFDVPFYECVFDVAVLVESLHHFTKREKIPLYTKLHTALKNIVKQSVRYIKRVKILPINDIIVYKMIRSNGGLSEWNFTIDFISLGNIVYNQIMRNRMFQE